jgi:hypothetical protein
MADENMAPFEYSGKFLFAFHDQRIELTLIPQNPSPPRPDVPSIAGSATVASTSPVFEAICKAIEHATAVQNKQYDVIDGYSICFEADDTDAAKDAE